MGVPLLLVVVVAAGVWLAFTGSRALAAVRDLEGAVTSVRTALADNDAAALAVATQEAQDAARRADGAMGGPVWGLVAAIPYIGDTPEAARVTARAVVTAADGLDPLIDVRDVLEPAGLYSGGRVDVDRLQQAQQPLAVAADAMTSADEIMRSAPTAAEGAWVIPQVDDRRAIAAEELANASRAISGAAVAADVLPSLLGAEAPRTWFVGIQSPAEARGTGGLAGNYVILEADDGRLRLVDSRPNSDFGVLSQLPDFGEQFLARYGQDPRRFGNSNLSAHFPYAAEIWRDNYQEFLQGEADVVMGTDVVALGYLIEAFGSLTLPDGRTVTGGDAVELALAGVYREFPDDREREQFQADVAASVFEQVTSGAVQTTALVDAFAAIVGEGRLQLWSSDPQEASLLLRLPTSGAVAARSGPSAYPVVINASATKLDTYLERRITYEVDRCADTDDMRSRVSVTLTSAIPEDEVLGDEAVGRARIGPQGPLSRVQLQVHLSPNAILQGVTLDGEPIGQVGFIEQGLPSSLVVLDLEPRKARTVVFELTEPRSAAEPIVTVQPLARSAEVETVALACDPAAEGDQGG